MNQFCCKLTQVVHESRAWNIQLWGSGGQRSGSQEVEVRFGGDIILDSLCWVGFQFHCIPLWSDLSPLQLSAVQRLFDTFFFFVLLFLKCTAFSRYIPVFCCSLQCFVTFVRVQIIRHLYPSTTFCRFSEMCVKLDVTPVRLDSDLSTALYKSFTYLFTYLLFSLCIQFISFSVDSTANRTLMLCCLSYRHEWAFVAQSLGLSHQRQTRKHWNTEETERQVVPCRPRRQRKGWHFVSSLAVLSQSIHVEKKLVKIAEVNILRSCCIWRTFHYEKLSTNWGRSAKRSEAYCINLLRLLTEYVTLFEFCICFSK